MIIGQQKGIPFIRVYPDNSLKGQIIERSPEVELLASVFISRGGRFLIAVLPNDTVRAAAVVEGINGDVLELAVEAVPNGFMLPPAIDRLVRAGVAAMGTLQ